MTSFVSEPTSTAAASLLDLTSVLSPGSVVPRLVPTISHGEKSPFVRGPNERHLRLLVDNARLSPCPELDALLELGQLPEVDLVTTAPSPGLSRMTFDRDEIHNNMITVFTEHPDGSGTYTGIDWVDQIRQDAHRYAVQSGEAEVEVERRFLIAGSGLLSTDGIVLSGWYHPDRKGRFAFQRGGVPRSAQLQPPQASRMRSL